MFEIVDCPNSSSCHFLTVERNYKYTDKDNLYTSSLQHDMHMYPWMNTIEFSATNLRNNIFRKAL